MHGEVRSKATPSIPLAEWVNDVEDPIAHKAVEAKDGLDKTGVVQVRGVHEHKPHAARHLLLILRAQ